MEHSELVCAPYGQVVTRRVEGQGHDGFLLLHLLRLDLKVEHPEQLAPKGLVVPDPYRRVFSATSCK